MYYKKPLFGVNNTRTSYDSSDIWKSNSHGEFSQKWLLLGCPKPKRQVNETEMKSLFHGKLRGPQTWYEANKASLSQCESHPTHPTGNNA